MRPILDTATPRVAISGRVRIEWEESGESGRDGNGAKWNPSDPSDWPGLRFRASVNVAPEDRAPEWQEIEDGTYLTALNAETTTAAQRQAILEFIMGRVRGLFEFAGEGWDPGEFFGDPDRELAVMSYIELSWLDTGVPPEYESMGLLG